MKIAFVHSKPIWYRVPFFNMVGQLYDVDFLFTHADKVEGLHELRYEVLSRYCGVAFSLIPRLVRGDYNVIIGGLSGGMVGIIEMFICFTIAKLRRKIYVQWSEDWDSPKKSLRYKLFLYIFGIVLSRSDVCLVPGTKHRQLVLSLGAVPERTFIMPNASTVNITQDDHLAADTLRAELGIEDKKVILFVGQLIEKKGVHFLIPAFDKLRRKMDNVILLIVGDGSYKQRLKLLCKNLDLEAKVNFVGWVLNQKLAPYYLLSNLVVVPSICLNIGDQWVLVVNEAQWCRKPVVATTAVGAAYELIENGVSGYIVPEKDPEALCEAMEKILSHPEIENRMGLRSQQIVENSFSYEHMVRGFSQALEYIALKSNLKT